MRANGRVGDVSERGEDLSQVVVVPQEILSEKRVCLVTRGDRITDVW